MDLLYKGIKLTFDNKKIDIINKICIGIVFCMIILFILSLITMVGKSSLVMQFNGVLNDSITYLGILTLFICGIRLLINIVYEFVYLYRQFIASKGE